MNAREGMRRVGIVLGILGSIIGGLIGYSDLQTVWSSHRKFERLQALAVMKDVATAIKAYKEPPETLPADFFDTIEPPTVVSAARKADWFEVNSPEVADPTAEMRVDVNNYEGIKTVNADKTGAITSIQLATGEWVHREPETFKARLAFFARLLLPFCYPVIGFLIPWGTIRVFVWVGRGFLAPPSSA